MVTGDVSRDDPAKMQIPASKKQPEPRIHPGCIASWSGKFGYEARAQGRCRPRGAAG